VTLTPETRGHVCQKFHHPTMFKNDSDANLKRVYLPNKFFKENAWNIENI
jgi:hypothetical protein